MGMLIDGQWSTDEVRRTNERGEFVRNESPFRDYIEAGNGQFPAEANRYHLIVNAGCPWAYRALLYRSIKGLNELVSISYTQAAAGAEGWTFGETQEPVTGAHHMHDVYSAADSNFTGRCTVPVLWDKNSGTIVNNESADIIRMFNSAFDDISGNAADYYPEHLRQSIDDWNDEIYTNVNNGVYRCGFAQTQQAYDAAFDALFATLDKIDDHLQNNRYLCGDTITEADWRLFATLVRFDVAYYGQFRCNRQRIVDYEFLWPYTRDLFQQPGVAPTVDIEAIKGIYYGGRKPGILPRGPTLDFTLPHHRGDLSTH